MRKSLLSPRNRTQDPWLSHQCSNHWAMTTHDFQDLHTFPLYCWVVPLAAVSYSADHQLCAVRTPYRCRLETPPPPIGAIISGLKKPHTHAAHTYTHIYTHIRSHKPTLKEFDRATIIFLIQKCFLMGPITSCVFTTSETETHTQIPLHHSCQLKVTQYWSTRGHGFKC